MYKMELSSVSTSMHYVILLFKFPVRPPKLSSFLHLRNLRLSAPQRYRLMVTPLANADGPPQVADRIARGGSPSRPREGVRKARPFTSALTALTMLPKVIKARAAKK
jgi:hypothetical protein